MRRSPVFQGLAAMLANTSMPVKVLSLIVVISYFLSYSESAIHALSMTPGYFWPPHFHIWTAVTHCFFEAQWWLVVVDVATILLVGKLLEPLWGVLEMSVFFVVVNVGVAITCAIFYYILFIATGNTEIVFDVHIHGLAGYLAGVSVAVKQAMPDHMVVRLPFGKVTNSHVPITCFLVTLGLWAVGVVEGSYCSMYASGLVISWVYLRHYQLHANGSRGDMADSFAFATFFPNVMQPPLNACFDTLVRLRICKKRIRRYDVGASSSGGPSISISLPGVDNHDTERRRQIALKALSDRLNKTALSQEGATSWPSMEDDEVEVEVHNPTPKRKSEESRNETSDNDVLISVDDHEVVATTSN